MKNALRTLICGLVLAPGLLLAQTATQACDVNDEIFTIQDQGILPPQIYFENLSGAWDSSQVDICFVNQSFRDVHLRYLNPTGNKVYTPNIPRGQTSAILLDKAPSEIRAVDVEDVTTTTSYACGTEEVRVCYWFWCTWETRTVYCEETTTEQVETVYTDMRPGRLIQGPVNLSY
ncbi:hypothetical protein [Loktanella sp. SALINAS62]|uniref:hypothetical protein n=1 Tax=Loktanella sp. SALINAS62 TaxID=2706124 RepID=UPI001B8C9199|nr:hypothetical protein [Loktanella sp. SALINAS62]MBS1303865.1 hypothetical protein [Loktanella sp. SALINAS62]